MKQVTEIPEWFARMPLDGYLNAKEVALLFGYSNGALVTTLVSRQRFVKPDKTTKCNLNKVNLWSKKIILQEIQRRKELANATSRD